MSKDIAIACDVETANRIRSIILNDRDEICELAEKIDALMGDRKNGVITAAIGFFLAAHLIKKP